MVGITNLANETNKKKIKLLFLLGHYKCISFTVKLYDAFFKS